MVLSVQLWTTPVLSANARGGVGNGQGGDVDEARLNAQALRVPCLDSVYVAVLWSYVCRVVIAGAGRNACNVDNEAAAAREVPTQ